MEHRRTLTMNWDTTGDDDDDDRFFESYERISSVAASDLAASSGSDEDEFEDSRRSFASCISSSSFVSVKTLKNIEVAQSASPIHDYGLWMSEPGDINERRKRLLQGMGLASNRNLLKVASAKIMPALSRKIDNAQVSQLQPESTSPLEEDSKQTAEPAPEHSPETFLVRSRSDGDIESFSLSTKKRKEELIGPVSKQSLTRTSSLIIRPNAGLCQYGYSVRMSPRTAGSKTNKPRNRVLSSIVSDGGFSSFFLIKNLDTGSEFIVKEYNDQGLWNKLSDLQTGKQLSMDEFEKSVGYSSAVKELMRREDASRSLDENRKVNPQSYLSKSFRYSKRRGVALLKNIKGVANSMSGLMVADKERENLPPLDQKAAKNSSQWVKVRHQGKSLKEFTALHLCQEIQAHDGSIWTMKFSSDGHFLASAGEDRMIHVWEVQECEVMSRTPDDGNSVTGTPVHPMASTSSDKPLLAELPPAPSERRKRGKHSSKKKNNGIPDYASVPETVFALSDKPICTFKGHLDDVLDLSWSRDLLLLSSSMDKTVRLWDMETKSCLKLFAHNDYVTCIQFNPVDDDYFISGSLDAKVRIWNISDRQVVDWTDLHEMVTAVCYTPNGNGAIIGSHKGNCRLYSIEDCKLEQKDQIEVRSNKKAQGKKVTGIQFAPWNPDEFLVTTADSRIRIVEGTDVSHKFTGFRNTNSQIAASFTPDGKFIIAASEDSQVYIWKHEHSGSGKGKKRILTQAHEHFPCRDVSVAIPWPGSIKNEAPIVEIHSKRHTRRFPSQSTLAIDSPPREDNVELQSKRHSRRLSSQSNLAIESPPREDSAAISNSKRQQLPPLPKKNNVIERVPSCADEDFQSSRMDPGIGVSESFTSASASERFSDSPPPGSGSSRSQSWSSSWSLFDGGSSHGGQTVQATAWGMVIVTATMGGEIRVYQNFGLPVKVGHLL